MTRNDARQAREVWERGPAEIGPARDPERSTPIIPPPQRQPTVTAARPAATDAVDGEYASGEGRLAVRLGDSSLW